MRYGAEARGREARDPEVRGRETHGPETRETPRPRARRAGTAAAARETGGTSGGGGEVAAPPRAGRFSLGLGIAAVVLLCCPLLPSTVTNWVRFLPVYFIVPMGIWAVASGMVALGALRGEEGADRRAARAGIALGAVAVVVPLGVVLWALWALRAYL
ncbi:hypothetical protein [Streptomyces sp. NPDC047928]|uniref:hypothetical protein n=1 Tax=unclassified Streptomyces TaxID=2593676 RepID=UPI00371C7E50